MKLHHLHLPVAESRVSEAFYSSWFGFEQKKKMGAFSFLENEEGFLLILEEVPGVAPLPLPFHFGFPLVSETEVEALYIRMEAAQVPMVKPLTHTDSLVSFRLQDPTGHVIEIYFLPE